MAVGADKLYEFLADEEDARVCKDISEEACREVPGNFFAILLAQFFTKLGDALSSPKIVLPWLFSGLGVPAFFTGLLVPVRESGSLLPQLLIGGVLRGYAVRKWFFVAGCLLQSLAIAGMAITALFFRGSTAGWIFIALLILFSLARGICSVASKDVLGKTIPKTRRGRIGGYSASAAGLITIGIGIALLVEFRAGTEQYIWLLVAASGCWLLASLAYGVVNEYPGATEGGGNALREAFASLALLQQDPPFRRFVIVRSLMMSSGLAAPYFILLARQSDAQGSLANLGWFVALSGIASLLSGPFWGKFADTSSRAVLLLTAGVTALLCAGASILSYTGSQWLLPLSMGLFFLLALVHQGVRLGRKTYLVDLAEGNRRTDYVAVSNTVIGIMLLLGGLLGAIVAQYSITVVLALLATASLLAVPIGKGLPEAQ